MCQRCLFRGLKVGREFGTGINIKLFDFEVKELY